MEHISEVSKSTSIRYGYIKQTKESVLQRLLDILMMSNSPYNTIPFHATQGSTWKES